MIKPTKEKLENFYEACLEKFQNKISDVQVNGTEITFHITLEQPVEFIQIQCYFTIEDNHEGMLFNPYSNKWSYL